MTTTPNGFVELCGLWKRKDKETGKEVPGLTGKMGGARVLVVRNKNKTAGDNKPDYHLVLTRAEPATPKPTGREPGDEGDL